MTILDEDGVRIELHEGFFPESLFIPLRDTLPWIQNRIRVFGKEYDEPRLTCWFGPPYRYASVQWPDSPWDPLAEQIRVELSTFAGFTFNAALGNFYRSSSDAMGWHRDNEPEIDQTLIASVSFGGTREFRLRNRQTGKQIRLALNDRSLLLMWNAQDAWEHSVPRLKRYNDPRINLTYRRISF